MLKCKISCLCYISLLRCSITTFSRYYTIFGYWNFLGHWHQYWHPSQKSHISRAPVLTCHILLTYVKSFSFPKGCVCVRLSLFFHSVSHWFPNSLMWVHRAVQIILSFLNKNFTLICLYLWLFRKRSLLRALHGDIMLTSVLFLLASHVCRNAGCWLRMLCDFVWISRFCCFQNYKTQDNREPHSLEGKKSLNFCFLILSAAAQ